MSTRELDMDFRKFTEKNFEKPSKCKNIDQARFYVKELSNIIRDFKERFNYVPNNAYSLLAQYNQIQNRILFQDYKNTYL